MPIGILHETVFSVLSACVEEGPQPIGAYKWYHQAIDIPYDSPVWASTAIESAAEAQVRVKESGVLQWPCVIGNAWERCTCAMQPFPHDTAATFWPKERLISFAALVSTLLVLIKPEHCALVTFITQQVLKQALPLCGDVNQLP